MERWLTQRLSAGLGASPGRSDGVCANVDFPTPRRLAESAVAAASGIDPAADPWLPERSVWPLLEIVEGSIGEPWLALLAEHLAQPDRRFAAAAHLAALFDRYALHRPQMLREWAAGEAGGGGPHGWQAELWRRLDRAIPEPGPAERIVDACARLRAQPELADLPPRLALFGLTRLPAGRLAVLEALAEHRDVHLFLLHPSPALWERLAGHPPVTRRKDDPTAALPQNPLLASWGHDARELQLVLAGAPHQDHLHANPHAAGTLLARIQSSIRGDTAPEPALLADRSVQIHSCHGRARQVEVLRDAILHELAEDPTLEPRDVIVMCPDIETFAPLIQAAFGATDDEPEQGPDLRVRLADRSLRQTNPVLGVVARLVELADGRLTASQVLDLADREPVRRRFDLDDDDLARIEEWVRASGIRWGLDAAHREPFKLGALATGTWRAGLDRLLLGVTMTEDDQRLFAGVLPLDDVESGAIDLAGRFAELLDRLAAAVHALAAPKPMSGWATALAAAADALTATAPLEGWQRGELQRLLDDLVEESAGHATPLTLGELRDLLADRLRGRPTRANFRTGHLTVCTLVPMRSVPHRIVCLLGLDDGVFPRRSPRDGDDLLLDDPHVGERDARTEDRQLLLDALMAATDRLLITYTGNDERTNLVRPPAVPVGELLDVIERAGTPREQVVTRHPLQPFDARNFSRGELQDGRIWSFDATTLDGALALAGERRPPGPFLPEPLPPRAERVVELADLERFVSHPTRAFLRLRLGLTLSRAPDDVEDALSVELDGLEEYAVGERLLQARLAGVEPRPAILAEIARGVLPPGVLGKPVIEKVQPTVEAIFAQVPAGTQTSVDVRVELPGGRLLAGTVPGVAAGTLRAVAYSRLGPRHRLVAWTRLLTLTVAHPGERFEALTVGRATRGEGVATARIPPLDVSDAREHLHGLVDLFDRGMLAPPPLACRTSAAYAEGGVAAAREAWESTHVIDLEDAEPEHQLVLGGVVPLSDLTLAPARPDETGPYWDASETRRFGRWAHRLWDPLLQVEQR